MYIPNAKIPVSCNKCYKIGLAHRLRDLGGHCPRMDLHYSPDEQDFKGDRRADCPLLGVPPHGRLGDLDALAKRIKDEGRNQAEFYADRYHPVVMAYGDCYGKILSAPTIIPAEEGE